MSNKDSYIKLRKSLDSFSNTILAEYDLKETDEQKQKFTDSIHERVKEFISKLSKLEQSNWRRLGQLRAKEFEEHAKDLTSQKHSNCPPGFIEVDGICVPI